MDIATYGPPGSDSAREQNWWTRLTAFVICILPQTDSRSSLAAFSGLHRRWFHRPAFAFVWPQPTGQQLPSPKSIAFVMSAVLVYVVAKNSAGQAFLVTVDHAG